MPKRPATKTPSNVAKRSSVAVKLNVKLDIVKRHEHGEGTSVIGRVHGLAPSMVHSIRTVVKSADKIKEIAGSATPLTATKVTRFRDAEMENPIELERFQQEEMPLATEEADETPTQLLTVQNLRKLNSSFEMAMDMALEMDPNLLLLQVVLQTRPSP
ncbi:CENPB DNA-binding domain containing protein 1-like 37 [Homarus americanus]|uniref:CENPB DNA-binding domain containing protein 1-like 37 n=1 Tax=Homarus americanus TaxID=6706 RepID=A0A8J5MTQ2_HOMAM|nr:CENPB DNA-binding domain containing protein 1-like 37 [Homarus americanus]